MSLGDPVDERRHSAARTVTAMGEEPLRISHGAVFTAMDRGDPRSGQPHSREPVQVSLPSAAIVGSKTSRRFRVKCSERVAHIITDFE